MPLKRGCLRLPGSRPLDPWEAGAPDDEPQRVSRPCQGLAAAQPRELLRGRRGRDPARVLRPEAAAGRPAARGALRGAGRRERRGGPGCAARRPHPPAASQRGRAGHRTERGGRPHLPRRSPGSPAAVVVVFGGERRRDRARALCRAGAHVHAAASRAAAVHQLGRLGPGLLVAGGIQRHAAARVRALRADRAKRRSTTAGRGRICSARD